MADKTLPLDATGQLKQKYKDNGDDTHSMAVVINDFAGAQGSSILKGRATGGTVTTLVDTAKNLSTDLLKDKLALIMIDGVEYVRKITANTADTITFADLVAKVSATAVIEKTDGGKVTITAVPEGTYANDYQVVVQQGEGASAETTAVFEDGVLTITLGTDAGTAASVELGSGADGTLTITRKDVGVSDLYVSVAVSLGLSSPLSVHWLGDSFNITLGTDEAGAADNTKNTVALIADAINNDVQLGALFTAVASGEGTGVLNADDETSQTDLAGGVDPVIDATAAEVAAAVDDLADFSAAETTAGLLDALEEPVAFSGGVDEVKPVAGVEYYILLDEDLLTADSPGVVSLSGSIVSQAIIEPVTVSAGETSADSTILDYHAKFPKKLLLTIVGTFATTSATTGLRLNLYYSPDGITYDTEAYAIIEPSFDTSSASEQTKQKSRPVLVGPGYYKCAVTNLDGNVNATAVKVTASEVV